MAKQKPNAPSGVSISRESTQKFKCKWSKGSGAGSGDKAYDSQVTHWKATTSSKKTSNGKTSWVSDGDKKLSDKNQGKGESSDTITINRKEFYPLKEKRLTAIKCSVEAKNNIGSASSGTKSYTFKTPQDPVIDMSYEASTGLMTITITSPKDDIKDRYDCQYNVYRQDKNTGSSRYGDGTQRLALNRSAKEMTGTSTKDSFTLYTDIESTYLEDGAKITITVEATCRGFAGNSNTKTKTYVLSTPVRAKITKIDIGNIDTLSLIKNITKKQFTSGSVRVFYNAADGAPSAEQNSKEPNAYSLERAITPWSVNMPFKAQAYNDWTTGIDTNEGSTSETAEAYNYTATRYTDFVYTGTGKANYYTAKDNKTGKRTSKFGAWKLNAYKAKKYKVGKKKKKRYSDFKVAKTAKIKIFKCYDKKNKKWVTGIKAYEYTKYKKKKYTYYSGSGKNKKKHSALRYKSFTKTGTGLVPLYSAKDNKTGKTKTKIPEYQLSSLKKATYVRTDIKKSEAAINPDDGVLGEPVVDVLSDMGFSESGGIYNKRVWYRIKAERIGIVEYSEPFEAEAFRAPSPSAKEDYSGFMRIVQNPVNVGTSILGTVGWNNAEKTDEGVDNPAWRDAVWTTLVQWSEFDQAHQSNQPPSEMEIDWHNNLKVHQFRQNEYARAVKEGNFSTRQGGRTVDKAIVWKSSADFAIYGLEPGVPIYLWTCRHMVIGEFDELGPRSTAPTYPKGYFPFTPIDNPTQVGIYLPEYYEYGSDLTVSWSHNAVCQQKSWAIYAIPAEDMSVYEAGETNVTSIPKKLIAAGTGRRSTTTIPGETLRNIIGRNACIYNGNKAFTILKKLCLIASVSTGGDEIYSFQDSKKKYVDTIPMSIIYPPTCAMYIYGTMLNSQMRKVFLFTNTPGVYGVLNCYAKDSLSLYMPDKTYTQAPDECVWNTRVDPTEFYPVESIMTADERRFGDLRIYCDTYRYVAIVNIPPTVKNLYNLGRYRMEAHTVNVDAQQFKSETVTRDFVCEYRHVPQVPGTNSRVEADLNDSYMKNLLPSGYHDINTIDDAMSNPPTAYIYCAVPDSGYSPTDRCRVYRVTPDGAEVIADDVPFETIVVDRYAPFSKVADTRYILATVTTVGEVAWKEVRYNMRRHGMRFDWGDYENAFSLELPFDIELNPSYEKNVRIDNYVDGSVQAHFNMGVSKTETVSSKLVRLQNPYQFELVKKLGQHAGTAFFRAHDGSAYECVCRVSGLANNFDSQTSPVSLDLTRVTTSARFKPRSEDLTTEM